MSAPADAGEAVMDKSVLVLSSDALAAALLGALAETEGYRPLFAAPDETARAALGRLRPRIVLVDCEHADACSDAFFGPAQMIGAAVLLFGSNRSADRLRTTADRYHLATFTVPVAADTLARLLAEADRRVKSEE
jgi:hypothetical protein